MASKIIQYKEVNGCLEKQCTKCKEWYPNTIEYFNKDNRRENGLEALCKKCKKEYRDLRKEEMKKYNKEYREKNKILIKEYQKEYYQKNKKEYLEKCKEYQKEYREKNKEYISKRKKEYNKRTKEHAESLRLKRKYNLTLEEYNKMLLEQDNKCAICGDKLKAGVGGRSIDHCHSTGKVRGILCMKCNTTLGMYKENIKTLKSMITYLEIHKAN